MDDTELEAIVGTFCDPRSHNKCMREPFVCGAFLYATDGYAAVRVPTKRIVDWNDQHRVMADRIDLVVRRASGSIMPDVLDGEEPRGKERPCTPCSGMGYFSECPECEGVGCVTWWSGNHQYTADCQECDGERFLPDMKGEPCSNCGGEGIMYGDALVVWMGQVFNWRYVKKVLALPHLRMCYPPKVETRPRVFTWGDDFAGTIVPFKTSCDDFRKEDLPSPFRSGWNKESATL